MARKAEEVKPLVFVNGETNEEVIIEFNREIVLQMEREGLSGEKISAMIDEAPISTVADLFYYGMLMHQPNTTRKEAADFLFDNVGFNDAVIERLARLFEKPYSDMIEAQRKNSHWTVR